MHHTVTRQQFEQHKKARENIKVQEAEIQKEPLEPTEQEEQSNKLKDILYSIPEDSVEAKDLDNLRVKFTELLFAELAKHKKDLDLDYVNKLMETVDNARRVYTGLALFPRLKFNLLK